MKKGWVYLTLLLLLTASLLAQVHHEKGQYTFEKAESNKHKILWRDYEPAAFQEAQEQTKPIFLLLTAPSWCYWCQVYESEDYLFHPQMVTLINEQTIPVYVDADKRQDLTRKYLEGGWPSTTLLTPAQERIFGYSGPRPVEFMLTNIQNAVTHVQNNPSIPTIKYNYKPTTHPIPPMEHLESLLNSYATQIVQSYDPQYGGFGQGQKFPRGRTLKFALELYDLTGNPEWLQLVQNTLENQYTDINELHTNYNLFDPVEGGFHRYGVNRDWTPPHYEKMLYDNAKLLKAYAHLLSIEPENEMAQEVVQKTIVYIQENWFDDTGGFWANTDVAGEHYYYAENPRPTPKARVEKTKFSNWNGEMISTYLFLARAFNQPDYGLVAVRSLEFFQREMITDQGAYHYYQDGTKGVRGNLFDNAYLLMAFVEGYEVIGEQEFLNTAKKLADYSKDNLYDWNSGGFFERNSPDLNNYALGEHIALNKPAEENGIMVYSLLKLYTYTNEPIYLHMAIKTFANRLNSIGGLDEAYYYVKSAQLVGQNQLRDAYTRNLEQTLPIEIEKQNTFWLHQLLEEQQNKPDNSITGFVVAEDGLDKLDSSLPLLIIIALIAGFLSFASPCTLPILPAFIAYTLQSSKQNIKGMSLSFFLGLATTFTILGLTATFIGQFLRSQLELIGQITGIAIILFAIYMLTNKGLPGIKIKQTKPTTYLSTYIFGAILGISWTPCVGPILVAILLLASTSSSTITGGIMLFTYTIGLAIPLLLVAFFASKNSKIFKILKGKEIKIKNYTIHTTTLISALLFIILGVLIFTGTLYSMNQYLSTTSFQQAIFTLEDKILSIIGK